MDSMEIDMGNVTVDNMRYEFFEAIRSCNNQELVKLTRNDNCNIWEYRDDEGYTGYPQLTNTMIDELKRRLGLEAGKIIHDWVNEKNDQGFTAIHYAAYKGDIEIIKKLLSNGADHSALNRKGLNVLHMAAQGDQPNSLVYFKDNEQFLMDIQSIDDLGSTPLHWACYTGSDSAFSFLVSWNPEVNRTDKEGLTALHLAVRSEKLKMIKKLLQKGANKDAKDNKGRSPIKLAYEKKNQEIIKLFSDTVRCQLCAVTSPLQKLEKSSFNIIFFVLIHLFTEAAVFFFILPFLDSRPNSIFYLIMICLVMANFLLLIFVNSEKYTPKTTFLNLLENKQNLTEYCPTCILKTENNSKHCNICNKCVPGFDHHCYWVNNCIGEINIRWFLLFLILIVLNLIFNIYVCGYVIFGNTEEMSKVDIEHTFPPKIYFLGKLYLANPRSVISIFCFIIALIFAIPVSILLVYHLRNILFKTYKDKNYESVKTSNNIDMDIDKTNQIKNNYPQMRESLLSINIK